MKNRVLLAVIFLAFMSMGIHGQEVKSKKQKKEEEKIRNFETVKDLINSSSLIFHAQRATPQNGKSIDLTTNPGTLKIEGDTVIADLPYFGRSFSGGYSNTDGGMKFTGVMEAIKLEYNEKRYKVTYSFTVKDGGNSYQCYLDISTVQNVSLSITTANRSTISYSGKVEEFE